MKNSALQNNIRIEGQPTAPGIAVGSAYVFKPFEINLAELNSSTDQVETEIGLFESARLKVQEQLNLAFRESQNSYGDQFSAIFESQIAFLNDPVLIDELKSKIQNYNQTAAYTVSTVLSEKSEYFISLENTYFRERAFDIIDLKQKLLLALFGIQIDYQLTSPSIIVAENLSPTDTVNFNRNLILGFLTDQGGQTSHSAILARGLQIPSVVNATGLSKVINNNDELIIDGFSGTIIINPDVLTREKYLRLKEKYEEQETILLNSNTETAKTVDGIYINVEANIEFLHEVSDVNRFMANGVGLYRTEALFLESGNIPSEQQQFNIYKKIAEGLGEKPFVIRTVDLGGDKLLEGFSEKSEQNPFLGWRAIRFCLDNPEIFKPQIRAILKASQFGNIRILLPMINTVAEILQVKEIIIEVRQELKNKGYNIPEKIDLGIMIETPAAAIMAPELIKFVDFLSIGSNDLTQYVLAIDRTNSKVTHSYNSFEPSVLRLMHCAIEAANKNKMHVSICGEFASIPAAVPILIGMGLRSLSVSPHFIPRIKKIIRSVNSQECVKLYDKIKTLHHASDIEQECNQYIHQLIPELFFSKEDI